LHSITSSARTVSLDLLRLIAVLLVFGAHIYPCPPELSTALYHFTETWKRGGYVGVDIFFVLSGFLVSGLLFREYQREGTVNVGRFLVRRAFKLYPSLWVLVVAGAYLYAPVEWYQLVGELLFLQNYVGNIWLHTWSLAVEEHFYLFISLLTAYWITNTPPHMDAFRHLPRLFWGIAIVSLVLRILLGMTIPYSPYIHGFPTHVRLDGLMLGTFISYLWHFQGLAGHSWWRQHRYALLLIGILLLSPAFIVAQNENAIWLSVIGNNFFDWGGAALLLGFLAFDFQSVPVARGLGRIGSYSYSIYLWHLPIEIITRTIMEPRGLFEGAGWYGYALIYVIGSILWGMAMYVLVELPFMRLRDRWFPSRAALMAEEKLVEANPT
jgi:peptidoglycan/LPS O-acetylase OafA/YrhL